MAENSASGVASGAATGATLGGGWGAAIGGALGLAGSMLGASSAKKASKQSLLYNMWALEQQKAWEKEKATHAHQWEMEDLKKAGLNPALTAMGGQGASTGSISPQGLDTSGYNSAAQIQSQAIPQAVQALTSMQATSAQAGLEQAQMLKTLQEAGILERYGDKEAISRIILNMLTGGERKSQADFNNMINQSLSGFKNIFGRLGNFLDDVTGGGKPKPKTKGQKKMSQARNAKEAYNQIMFGEE